MSVRLGPRLSSSLAEWYWYVALKRAHITAIGRLLQRTRFCHWFKPSRFMASPAIVLRLYRHILRNAMAFPSIKRDALVENIKLEFRENRDLEDGAELQQKLDVASKGLQQLRSYTGLDSDQPNWSVKMTETPMPKPPESEEGDEPGQR